MPDIFISYASEDVTVAVELATGLAYVGYDTWYYDKDSLPGGDYLAEVSTAIEAAKALIVLVSEYSLSSRQVNNEVVRAYESGKLFVPVLLGIDHATFQERQPTWRQALGSATSIRLPAGGIPAILEKVIAGLRRLDVQPSGATEDPHRVRHQHMEGAGHSGKGRYLLTFAALFALLTVSGVLVSFLGVLDRHREANTLEQTAPQTGATVAQSSADNTDDGLSSLRLDNGLLMFRTEAFHPAGGRLDEQPTLGPANAVTEVDLSFQLINRSASALTLSQLAILQLGTVITYEDDLPPTVVAALRMNSRIAYSSQRTDLGLLDVSWPDSGRASGADSIQSSRPGDPSRNLLDRSTLEVLSPNSVRSFALRLRCRATEEPAKMLVVDSFGFEGSHPTLATIDRHAPRVSGGAHLFAISVDILTEGGERGRLYSDWLYVLFPRTITEFLQARGATSSYLTIERWHALPPGELISEMVAWSVKTLRETLAFRVATDTNALPSHVNPEEIAPFCYSGDLDSSLRPLPSGDPNHKDDNELQAFVQQDLTRESIPFGGPIERSNLVHILRDIRKNYPPLWRPLARELGRLAQRQAAGAKAQFVLAELERPTDTGTGPLEGTAAGQRMGADPLLKHEMSDASNASVRAEHQLPADARKDARR